MQTNADDVKVLFLAGKGRSGGTLLANLMGQMPGFCNVGELNRLWDSGLVHNHRCGCGLPVQECPTWAPILDEADAIAARHALAPLADAHIDRDQGAVVRWPRVLRLLRARVDTRDRWEPLDRYTTAIVGRVPSDRRRSPARVSSSIRRGFRSSPSRSVSFPMSTCASVTSCAIPARSCSRGSVRASSPTATPVEHLPRFGAAFSTTSWLARNVGRRAAPAPAPGDHRQLRRAGPRPGGRCCGISPTLVGEAAGRPALPDLRLGHARADAFGRRKPRPHDQRCGRHRARRGVAARDLRPATGSVDHRARAAAAPALRFPDPQPAPHSITAGIAPTTASIRRPRTREYARTAQRGRVDRSTLSVCPTLSTNAWLRFDAIRASVRIARAARPCSRWVRAKAGSARGSRGTTSTRASNPTPSRARHRRRAAGGTSAAAVSSTRCPTPVRPTSRSIWCARSRCSSTSSTTWARSHSGANTSSPDGWILLSVPAHAAQFGPSDEHAGHFRRYEQNELAEPSRTRRFPGRGAAQLRRRARLGAAAGSATCWRAARGRRSASPEELTSASGRYFQPHAAVGRAHVRGDRGAVPGGATAVRRLPTSAPATSFSPVDRSDAANSVGSA